MGMVNMTTKRLCPCCSNSQAYKLCTIQLCAIEDERLPLSFDVVACAKCGFCFDDMAACQKDFDDYYAGIVKYQIQNTYGSGEFTSAEVNRYDDIYSFCKTHLANDSKILDIGSGKMGLLKRLSQLGFKNLYAIEPSALKEKDDKIITYDSLDEVVDKNSKFDFVFCTQVLEHVFDVEKFIHNLSTIIEPQGACYIEIPDSGKYSASYIAPFHLFDREHINHFTSRSLNTTFGLRGFTKKSERKFHYVYENIGCIFKKGSDGSELVFDAEGRANIENYVYRSLQQDGLEQLHDAKSPIILWGLGAYLRRIILKNAFPKNIAAIIDRDRGGKGLLWNGIPLVTADVLSNAEFSHATVIITSVLYADEIKRQISSMNFKGTVLTAF